MASIGQIVEQTSGSDVLARARQRAALVPDCMVEARRIANTVTAGWHGRRKRGIGENFHPGKELTVEARRENGETFSFKAIARVDSPIELDYYRHGGILQFVLRQIVSGAS